MDVVKAVGKDYLGEQLGINRLKKDSVFSWFVCFCSFLSHIFHSGYSFAVAGNVYHYLQHYLHIEESTSNWIVSLHLCLRFVCGIPSAVIIKKSSLRFAQVFGGLCVILSHALCTVATKPWQLFVIFGVVGGFGQACTYTASSEILRFHFHRHIYLATALVTAGCFVGVCVNPLVVQAVIDKFGFGDGMGILSLFHFIHIITGVFYMATPDQDIEDNNNEEEMRGEERKISKDSIPSKEQAQCDINSAANKNSNHVTTASDQRNGKLNLSDESSDTHSTEKTTIPLWFQLLELLKSVKVWLYLANMFLRNLGIISFFTLIGEYMRVKLDIEESEALMGITISGGLGLLGVVLVSAVSQLRFDRMIIQAVTNLAIGFITIAILYSRTVLEYYAGMVLYGAFYGASIANMLGISYGICGPEQMIMLHSMALACESIGSLIGSPLCAWLASNFGSKTGMILAGCCDIAAVLVVLPPVIQKFLPNTKDANSTQSSEPE